MASVIPAAVSSRPPAQKQNGAQVTLPLTAFDQKHYLKLIEARGGNHPKSGYQADANFETCHGAGCRMRGGIFFWGAAGVRIECVRI